MTNRGPNEPNDSPDRVVQRLTMGTRTVIEEYRTGLACVVTLRPDVEPAEVRQFKALIQIVTDGSEFDEQGRLVVRLVARVVRLDPIRDGVSAGDLRAYAEFCTYVALQMAVIQERLDAEAPTVREVS
jgi:hypothetical protein